MTELKEIRDMYKEAASFIGDYENMSKTKLANIYCDADEAPQQDWKTPKMRDGAFAALMLRYWGKISRWVYDSASLKLEDVEFVEWLAKALWVAFYYREWRDEYKAVYKHGKFIEWKLDENGKKIPNPYYYMIDEDAVDKIINRCCFSIRGREYQFFNHDKRKSVILADSLEAMTEEVDDAALAFTGCVYEEEDPFNGVNCLIEMLVKKNRKMDALIINEIVFDESSTTRKIEGKQRELFDERKVVRNLAEADYDLVADFCRKYSIGEPQSLYEELKGYSNPKLYVKLRKLIKEIRNNPKLLSCLLN